MALSMFPPLLADAGHGHAKASARPSCRSTSRTSRRTSSCSARSLAFMVVALAEACSCCWRFCSPSSACRLAGDPTPFLVATLLYAFCVAAFGTMVGAAIPNQAGGHAGGDARRVPAGLHAVRADVPARRTCRRDCAGSRTSSGRATTSTIVRDAFLQGGGWPAVWCKVLAIGGIGGLFFTLAWRRMRRMQAGGVESWGAWLTRLVSHTPAGADPEGAESDQARSAHHRCRSSCRRSCS